MYVLEFNAMYGFFILSSVYYWAFEFSSTIGTGTVSNWYKINGCCVYGCMKTGNCIIKFQCLSMPKVTSFIS